MSRPTRESEPDFISVVRIRGRTGEITEPGLRLVSVEHSIAGFVITSLIAKEGIKMGGGLVSIHG